MKHGIVIDGPPRIHELAKSVILAADVVLIPVLPSPLDVWATAETVDLVIPARPPYSNTGDLGQRCAQYATVNFRALAAGAPSIEPPIRMLSGTNSCGW